MTHGSKNVQKCQIPEFLRAIPRLTKKAAQIQIIQEFSRTPARNSKYSGKPPTKKTGQNPKKFLNLRAIPHSNGEAAQIFKIKEFSRYPGKNTKYRGRSSIAPTRNLQDSQVAKMGKNSKLSGSYGRHRVRTGWRPTANPKMSTVPCKSPAASPGRNRRKLSATFGS